MSTPSLQLVKLIAHFVRADTGSPLTHDTYRVRFYDFDLLKEDALGESSLSAEGVTEVICDADQYQTGLLGRLFERLKEKKPDIFVEVRGEGGMAIYRSAIQWNLDPFKADEVTGRINPTIDLGTYRFRPGEGIDDQPGGYGIHRPMM